MALKHSGKVYFETIYILCQKKFAIRSIDMAEHMNYSKPSISRAVGNDVAEDMIAEQLGMKVFLLTDCLINKNNADISCYPHGSFDELFDFIYALER